MTSDQAFADRFVYEVRIQAKLLHFGLSGVKVMVSLSSVLTHNHTLSSIALTCNSVPFLIHATFHLGRLGDNDGVSCGHCPLIRLLAIGAQARRR